MRIRKKPLTSKRVTPKRGEKVVLTKLPLGFVDDLPEEDQKAILAIVGKPIRFNGYDGDRMELEFAELNGTTHFIYVDHKYVTTSNSKSKKPKKRRK